MNREIWQRKISNDTTLKIVEGDITREAVDAIVNAANSHLQHGGGVAGAIVRAGGKEIQDESNKIGHVEVGKAAITAAGTLPAKNVIHAVGPRWGEGGEEQKLRNAVTNSLKLADEHRLKSISLPAISSGIFGFPKDRCAEVILKAISDYFEKDQNSSLNEVRICLFDKATLEVFLQAVS